MLERLTIAWVRGVRQAWVVVLLLAFVASVAAFGYVHEHLGIQTNTADMISPSLQWRQRHIDFKRHFPQFEDTLTIVVDAQSADRASQAAVLLSAALAKQDNLFQSVDLPADNEFFRRSALLLIDTQARTALIDELVNAQPLIGRLNRDPSLKSVALLYEDALRNREQVDQATLQRFASELANSIDSTLARRSYSISWRRLLGGKAVGGTQQIIRAAPHLDFKQLFPAAVALHAVRSTAQALDLTPEHGIRVRVTGGLAMSDEELRTVSAGAQHAALFALLGVFIVLLLGLGNLRMVLISLVCLLVGLLWTAAFAAFSVGHLNMISVAFAVLYIGLGVDYAVHFALRYRELLGEDHDHAQALDRAAGDVGVSIALCALTTGAGFLAFLPTSFAGVSELGLIAGAGMFISLLATLTIMPALMSACVACTGTTGRSGLRVDLKYWPSLDRIGFAHPRIVALVAALLAVLAVYTSLDVRFDENPLNLRDPHGEAVSTYRELVAKDNNWSLDVLVEGAAAAGVVARDLAVLPVVSKVIWVESFVPADQKQALRQIDDLALLLGPDLDGEVREPSPPSAALAALARLHAVLIESNSLSVEHQYVKRTLGVLLRRLATLDEQASDELLGRLQNAATGTLSGEIARMGDLLDARSISVETLPAALLVDWRAADGRLRLRIDAAEDLNDHDALLAFVEQVQGVAPSAVGAPIVHLESSNAVVIAFMQAFALALLCISIILYFALRRLSDVLIVLLPLLLGTLCSVAIMVWLQTPFNFANVIALPLLLGVGVDSGIHMLARARLMGSSRALASSSTARGVLISALTTTVSFGNLAFSPHPGTATMGLLLAIGMIAILAATLLVLPAMVRLVGGLNMAESH
ncbi:MAG: hopanoid biosynthesis associated RND transporter like protein HpnN [Gammaproteobacteria bacterium]|jgi:hopanoid biosynthesis associated RND transporter like protein HpnN